MEVVGHVHHLLIGNAGGTVQDGAVESSDGFLPSFLPSFVPPFLLCCRHHVVVTDALDNRVLPSEKQKRRRPNRKLTEGQKRAQCCSALARPEGVVGILF